MGKPKLKRPDDIPEWAWEEAYDMLISTGGGINSSYCLTLARALMAAHARGAGEERERCAQIALGWAGTTDYDMEPEAAVSESVTAKSIAASIRNGGTGT